MNPEGTEKRNRYFEPPKDVAVRSPHTQLLTVSPSENLNGAQSHAESMGCFRIGSSSSSMVCCCSRSIFVKPLVEEHIDPVLGILLRQRLFGWFLWWNIADGYQGEQAAVFASIPEFFR